MPPRPSATCPGSSCSRAPGPGRNARWTYLTADPVAVLESPAAGPDPFAVARRLVARLDRTAVVPADAPPFLGGLVGFLGYDLGAMPGAPAGDRAGRPGPAAAAARAPRLGRRLGPADRPRLARRPGARWRRPPAGTPARRRPRPADEPVRRAATRPDDPARQRPARLPLGAGPGGLRGRRRRDPRPHRRRRHLPGEPDAPARDPVRRRPVGPLSPPADGRPVALLGLPRPRSGPADRSARGRSCRPRPSRSCRSTPRASSRPTRSRARARAAATRPRTARSRASCCRAPRIAPRT